MGRSECPKGLRLHRPLQPLFSTGHAGEGMEPCAVDFERSRSTPMTEFFQRQYSPPSKSPDNRPLIITALLALGLVVLTILVVSRGRRKNPRQSWYLLEPPYCQFMSPAFSRGVNLYPPLLGARPTISLYTLGYLLLSTYCRELRPGIYRNSNILRPGTSFLCPRIRPRRRR